MLIYENQIATLGQDRALEYERRLIHYLRENVAARSAREVEPAEVRALIAEAHTAGLDTERQIAAYVAGAWVFGEPFLARIEPLRDSFGDPCIAPADKAKRLLEQFDQLQRESAAPLP